MGSAAVSKKLLKRLPAYLDYLKSLPEQSEHISATAIAKALGQGEVQVRKDLAKVSHTGRCRTGRSREQLIRDLEEYLNQAAETGMILVGTGNMCQALLDRGSLADSGMKLMASFDFAPVKGGTAAGRPIYPMSRLESFCKHYDVYAGVIAVSAENAQTVCDCLIACGVRAIWNYAPTRLRVPEHVEFHSENPAVL